MKILKLVCIFVLFIKELECLSEQDDQQNPNGGFCNVGGKRTPFHKLGSKEKEECMKHEHQSLKKSESRTSTPQDEYDDMKAVDTELPTTKLSRKKLSMLGAAGFYIQEFNGQLFEFAINRNWEGVWVLLSNVSLRVYGEIGEGRWRYAFRGMVLESDIEDFPVGMQIVIKTVNNDVLKEQTREEAVKRAIQTQMLARKICKVAASKVADGFGKFPEIIKVWMFRDDKHMWMIEERLQGRFTKLINNNMNFIRVSNIHVEDQEKASAIVHFSYNLTDGEIILTDLQGVDLRWTDVEIATRTLSDEKYFGIGNLGRTSHKVFHNEHQCNKFCKLLHLPHKEPRCQKSNVEEKRKSDDHSVGSKTSIRSQLTQNEDELLNVK